MGDQVDDAGFVDDVSSDAGSDAGAVSDAGLPLDAGASLDGGARIDAGADADAGSPPVDAGVGPEVDAGPPPCTSNASCGGGANVCGDAGVCFIDVTPPSVGFLSPVPGATVTSATVTVSGFAADAESGLAKLELSTDGVTFAAVPVVGGQFSSSLAVPLVQASPFSITARATDVGGLVSTATLTLNADRVGPSLAITSPAADGSCTATACSGALINLGTGSTFTISGTATDPAGVDSASLRILDGAAVLVPTTSLTLGASGAWSYTWSALPNVNGRAYVVEVSAVDTAGNASSTVTRTVLVDRVAPMVSFSSPSPGALLGSSTVTLAGTAADGASYGVASAETSLDGTTWSPTSLAADGSFSAALPVPVVDHVAQTLSLRVVDLAGNAKISSVSYLADRIAPVVGLTSPSLDYACPSATVACTGAVANASVTSYGFTGTLAEGGGVNTVSLAAEVYDPATKTVLQTSTPAASSPWSATWTGLPSGVNGHEYQLRITATDAAGNKSSPLIRKVWVDNVAPTAAALVANARLIPLTANLVTFSEPMVQTSALAAMTFTPAVSATSLAADVAGTTYAFTGLDLGYYAPYSLTVGTGATDRAGNPLAATVTEKFLTAAKPLTFPVQLLGPSGTLTPQLPRLVVDDDGRPAVSVVLGSGAPLLVQLRGDGVLNASNVQTEPTGTNWWTSDLRLTTNAIKPDLTRAWGLRMALVYRNVFNGSSLEYVARSDTGGWLNAAGAAGYDLLPDVSPSSAPIFDIDPPSFLAGEVLRVLATSPASVVTNNEFMGSWASPSVGNITGFQQQTGAASLDVVGTARTVRYWDHRGTSQVATSTSATDLLVSAGQPQRMTVDRFGAPSPLTPAFLVWGSTSGSGTFAQTALTVACSQTPTGAVPGWLASSKTVATGTGAASPVRLATALSTSLFVAAVDLGTSVAVVSVPSSSPCNSIPTVTVVGTVANAKQPAVAVDSAGKVWVAYVDTVTKALMLTRF